MPVRIWVRTELSCFRSPLCFLRADLLKVAESIGTSQGLRPCDISVSLICYAFYSLVRASPGD